MRVKNRVFILIATFITLILMVAIYFILNDFNSLNKRYILDDLRDRNLNYAKKFIE